MEFQKTGELSIIPIELRNKVEILKMHHGRRERIAAKIEDETQRIRQMMQEYTGATVEMEGEASRFYKPGEAFTDIPHHFEDWSEMPMRVTTGFRPMTILGVTDGVIVKIDGEDRYPILELHTIHFTPPSERGERVES